MSERRAQSRGWRPHKERSTLGDQDERIAARDEQTVRRRDPIRRDDSESPHEERLLVAQANHRDAETSHVTKRVGADEPQRSRAVVGRKNRLGSRLDANHTNDSFEGVVRRDHRRRASRWGTTSARGDGREGDACHHESQPSSGVRHRTRRMATRRPLDAASGVPVPPSKWNCSVVAADALNRKKTADVPGTPAIVCDVAPASGIGVIG